MTDDKICVFKDSDLKNFGKSICEINIEEREIKNIDSHRKDDPTSLWLKKHCEKKYAFALLANIPDDNRDESWITIQVGSGNKILTKCDFSEEMQKNYAFPLFFFAFFV